LEAAVSAGCAPSSLAIGILPSSTSPESLAPEVWKQDFGPKCDIWACGCLLFFLLTGHFPFGPGLALKDLVQTMESSEPDWRLFRSASTSALSLCRRMLLKDDLLRPTAAECLRHPWFESMANNRLPKELRSETLSVLMQMHARAKAQQVLMNVVARELKVHKLRLVPQVLADLDEECCGALKHLEFEAALLKLGISPQVIEQVIGTLDPESTGSIVYDLFLAGCVDLVDDKLDLMLWKVFSMVDEDHSGEISCIELEHFLGGVCDDIAGGDVTLGPVEQYLQGVLDLQKPAALVTHIARGQDIVRFENLKRFVMESDCPVPVGKGDS